MVQMRILAISDVRDWKGYDKIVARYAPDVVVLCGDLTSDGFASFWGRGFDLIPAFAERRDRLMKQFGILRRENGLQVLSKGLAKFDEFRRRVDRLEQKYIDTREFKIARRNLHTEPFYRFLRFAGQHARVLVVKGDHDEDFRDDYSVKKINGIRNCREISGKAHTINGFTFCGLGFTETHYRMRLREVHARVGDKVDVLIAHAEQRRVPLLAGFGPRVIIRGHFGSGCWLVSGIPAVFTADVMYSVVDLTRNGRPSLKQFTARFARSGKILCAR
jgi:Icc-related predicted phosphoesterase